MTYAYGMTDFTDRKIVETLASNSLAVSARGAVYFYNWAQVGLNGEIDFESGEVRLRYYPDGQYRDGESGLGPVVYTLDAAELAIVKRHHDAALASMSPEA